MHDWQNDANICFFFLFYCRCKMVLSSTVENRALVGGSASGSHGDKRAEDGTGTTTGYANQQFGCAGDA